MAAAAKLVIAMNSASPASIWRWPASATAALRAQFPEVEFAEYPRPVDQPASARDMAADAALFADADAALAWRLDPRLFAAAPRLRWIHCPAAAVHQLLSPELRASAIVVTNGASVHAETVAEHALALMLALARGLPQAAADQAARRWQPQPWLERLSTLASATAVIAGMGHIGRALAPKLAALGMTVIGIRRQPERTVDGVSEMHPPEALEPLLPRADYLVLALPATHNTAARIGAAQLARLRPTARLINVGRGTAVDEHALEQALRERRLDAAAIDVLAEEPLPSASPLWHAPRLLITPHVAAFVPDTWRRQTELVAAHLRRFLAGEALTPAVNKQLGY